MKIIKQGKNPFEKKCERCGCVFVYENSDIRSFGADVELGILPTGLEVSCPCCNLAIAVPSYISNKLPPKEEHFDL